METVWLRNNSYGCKPILWHDTRFLNYILRSVAGYYAPIAGWEGNIYIFQVESAYDIGEREISVFRMVHFANL